MSETLDWPNNSKVYITGKDGFIGGRLAARFGANSIEKLDNSYVDDETIKGVFHLAAITDTTFDDWNRLQEINIDWPKMMWRFCARNRIPFVYASSASVYGDGKRGFVEESLAHETADWEPLNKYAQSKRYFDMWALAQPVEASPPFWYGVRFFNVYGAHEDHKGPMASQVYQTINRVAEGKSPRFFERGEQKRDFVYVEDCVNHMVYLWGSHAPSGIYNSGAGIARSFNDVGITVMKALSKEIDCAKKQVIEYFPLPENLKDKFQSYTQADMTKLWKTAKYEMTPQYTNLEDGIASTVKIMGAGLGQYSTKVASRI